MSIESGMNIGAADVRVYGDDRQIQNQRLASSETVVESSTVSKQVEPTELIETVNSLLKLSNQDIRFEIDESRVVVRIVDSQNGDLIRQMPSEEMIKLSEKLSEFAGLIFDKRV